MLLLFFTYVRKVMKFPNSSFSFHSTQTPENLNNVKSSSTKFEDGIIIVSDKDDE